MHAWSYLRVLFWKYCASGCGIYRRSFLFYLFNLCFQIGDLKSFFGLFMVNMQMLRTKLKVLDATYGYGTGKALDLFIFFFLLTADGCYSCTFYTFAAPEKIHLLGNSLVTTSRRSFEISDVENWNTGCLRDLTALILSRKHCSYISPWKTIGFARGRQTL